MVLLGIDGEAFMETVEFNIAEELRVFLPRRLRTSPFQHHFNARTSVKDMVESLGVPHCEINALVVNGASVDFSYIVLPGDKIDVHANGNPFEQVSKRPLRQPYPGRPRFILDTHLGRLASYLRMLGFDTLYRNDYPDPELAQVAHDEQRILLTRDVGLLKRSLVIYGYYVRNTNPKKRIVEIMERFALEAHIQPFKHCLKCNGLLAEVDKADIIERLSHSTASHYDEFHICHTCGQVYWKGSHYQKMKKQLSDLLQ